MTSAQITAVRPDRAIEGARVAIVGRGFLRDRSRLPHVTVGGRPARVVRASDTLVDVLVPLGIESCRIPVEVDGVSGPSGFLEVGRPLATGLHQVDGPVFDAHGNLYVTYSGTRGQQVPVSVFRVRPNGTREAFSSAVVNATSMAFGPCGRLYVSSRFEGTVHRLAVDGTATPFVTDVGVACGLAFAPDGSLFVGDRSGTIFKVDEHGQARAFATVPASVAAFHLAIGPDLTLYVTGPTLGSYDVVYEISPTGSVRARSERFGRPQGVSVDTAGRLLVVEALAGASGVYRLRDGGAPELMVAGPGLVGVTVDARFGLAVSSGETVYRFDLPA
jgi:outer membrane protein assembly factor BamB